MVLACEFLMNKRIQLFFLALVFVQGLHSIEEYSNKLYEVFEFTNNVCKMINPDPRVGFVIGNVIFFVFGLLCYLVPVRMGWPSGRFFIWLWIVIEVLNGILHPAVAFSRGGYFPGVETAPFLLVLALWLAVLLVKESATEDFGKMSHP